jgi:hypothetical protein
LGGATYQIQTSCHGNILVLDSIHLTHTPLLLQPCPESDHHFYFIGSVYDWPDNLENAQKQPEAA